MRKFSIAVIGFIVLTAVVWAAVCIEALPGNDYVQGFKVMTGSTKSGPMPSDAAYECYDGAADGMAEAGIIRFARRFYENKGKDQILNMNVFEFEDNDKAKAYFNDKKSQYVDADPLDMIKIKDNAVVGTLSDTTVALLLRRKFVVELTISSASTAEDRAVAEKYLRFASSRLGQ